MPAADPHTEYIRRLDDRRENVARDRVLDGRLAVARGIAFLTGLGLLVLVYGSAGIGQWTLLVPIVVFLVLVVLHTRVLDRLKRSEISVDYYEAGIARLEDRWMGTGTSGTRYANAEHPYADDLDLFGHGSLFQLLCRSRTRLGEDTLADWLCHGADVSTIRLRQESLNELRDRLDLREQLALLDAEVHDDLDQNRLRDWSQEPSRPVRRRDRIAAGLLSVAAIAALGAWMFFDAPLSPLMLVLFAQIIFTFSYRRQIMQLVHTAGEAGSGLAILVQVLNIVENEPFETRLLKKIHEQFQTDGLPPSRQIARLHRLIQALNNCLQNQFYAPIAFLLCLPIHLIHRIEMWRAHVGSHIPDWLDAVGQFEALSTLAGYAWEHPDDPLPEISEQGPLYEGEQLGHPLIPAADCVRNDVALNDQSRLLLISGSNMSGKSTFLRTLGTNAVLALAGAPVRARRLQLGPVQLATAMRVRDSLMDGKSLFYASLSRLKMIVETSGGQTPLLFLLDEILQGTNSHDRRVGAEGIIRKLVEEGSIGLVTTHDLALTKIVDSFAGRAENVHFEDRIEDGKMTFDYNLRKGVVERSNALELMRIMGLDV